MTPLLFTLGILLLAMALFLIVAVLCQQGKAKGLSGAISGGSETFFGKTKNSNLLSKLTTIIAILFAVAVLAVYVVQPDYEYKAPDISGSDISDVHGGLSNPNETSATDETTAPATDESETPEVTDGETEPEA